MYKQPYLRALCGSKKYPYLYGWRLDLYPTPILVEFPVQLYTFTLKIWLLGPLPHWNLKWPSFLWVWIFFAWSLTLQWFLFSKPIIVSSHPNLLLLFRRRAVFPWVFRHNKPQLIDQSERAHWFGYCIKDYKIRQLTHVRNNINRDLITNFRSGTPRLGCWKPG